MKCIFLVFDFFLVNQKLVGMFYLERDLDKGIMYFFIFLFCVLKFFCNNKVSNFEMLNLWDNCGKYSILGWLFFFFLIVNDNILFVRVND